MIWMTLGIMASIVITAWVTIHIILKITSRASLDMTLSLAEIKTQQMKNAASIGTLEMQLLEARKASAQIILEHHTQICDIFTALLHLIQGSKPATEDTDMSNVLSMSCPFVNRADPANLQCRNESNTTGKCENKYCPFLS